MENWQLKILRCYPQLFSAVLETTQAWHSGLQVETVFGKKKGKEFVTNLDKSTCSQIEDMLSNGTWNNTSEWFLQVEYVQANHVWSVTHTTEVPVARYRVENAQILDFRYAPGELLDAHDQRGLHDHTLRIKLYSPDPQKNESKAFHFDTVRIKACREFHVESKNVQGVTFCFRLSHCWIGENMESVENKIATHQECDERKLECLMHGITDEMSPENLSLSFLSLFVKLQDFMDIPLYKCLLKDSTALPRNLPALERT
jgi:hypothetical protein